MIDEFKKILTSNLDLLGIKQKNFTGFAISKFAHNTRNDISKVIFLVSHNQVPIGVIKVLRNKKYNKFLFQEKTYQTKGLSQVFLSPKVYFEGQIGEYYFYVEEFIAGQTVNRYSEEILSLVINHQLAIEKKAILDFEKLLNIFQFNITDKNYLDLFKDWQLSLKELNDPVYFAVQHGDMDFMNIIVKGSKYYLIDWETVGDYFVWGLDLMHYLKRNTKYSNFEDFVFQIKNLKDLEKVNWSESQIKFLFLTDNLVDFLRKNYFLEYRNKLMDHFKDYEPFNLHAEN